MEKAIALTPRVFNVYLGETKQMNSHLSAWHVVHTQYILVALMNVAEQMLTDLEWQVLNWIVWCRVELLYEARKEAEVWASEKRIS